MKDRIQILAFALLVPVLVSACGEQPEEQREDDYTARMAEQHAEETPQASGAETLGEAAAFSVASETVSYGQQQGKVLQGYLAYPESAHGGLPGVMLFHEWWGLNDNIQAMANKLAGQGYVVLALDLYGGRTASDAEQARELMQATVGDMPSVHDNIRQAWKFMVEEIGALSVASVGWCLGGSFSLQAALLYPNDLAGAVIYYGHVENVPREQLATLNMPLLGIFGGEDDGIPVEGVRRFEQTLQELDKDAEIVIYDDAGHAFANPSGENFNAEAAEDAWKRTLRFLDRTLNAAVNRSVLESEHDAGAMPVTFNTR